MIKRLRYALGGKLNGRYYRQRREWARHRQRSQLNVVSRLGNMERHNGGQPVITQRNRSHNAERVHIQRLRRRGL